jgi:hypothetical protein
LERIKTANNQENKKVVKKLPTWKEKIMTSKEKRQLLYDVLNSAGSRLTPEQIFSKAGFDETNVDEFYEELRSEIKKRRIRQIRPNNKDVYLERGSS